MSLSARMRVEVRRRWWVARVRRAGEPGPEPASVIVPLAIGVGGGRGDGMVVEEGVVWGGGAEERRAVRVEGVRVER